MLCVYKANEESDYSHWRHIFDFAILTFALLLAYMLVVFVS